MQTNIFDEENPFIDRSVLQALTQYFPYGVVFLSNIDTENELFAITKNFIVRFVQSLQVLILEIN